MGKIQRVLDKNSVEVYPLTHERAVRDSSGVTAETKFIKLEKVDKVVRLMNGDFFDTFGDETGYYTNDANNKKELVANNAVRHISIQVDETLKSVRLSGFEYTPSSSGPDVYTRILFFDASDELLDSVSELTSEDANEMYLVKPSGATQCYIDVPNIHKGDVVVQINVESEEETETEKSVRLMLGDVFDSFDDKRGYYTFDGENKKQYAATNAIRYLYIPAGVSLKSVKLSGFTYTPSTSGADYYTRILFFDAEDNLLYSVSEITNVSKNEMVASAPEGATQCYVDVPTIHKDEVIVQINAGVDDTLLQNMTLFMGDIFDNFYNNPGYYTFDGENKKKFNLTADMRYTEIPISSSLTSVKLSGFTYTPGLAGTSVYTRIIFFDDEDNLLSYVYELTDTVNKEMFITKPANATQCFVDVPNIHKSELFLQINSTSTGEQTDGIQTSRYVSNIANLAYTYGSTPLVLLHFSDIHSSAVNYKRLDDFATAMEDYIDDVISTGDNVYNSWADNFAYWTNDKFLNVIGNHDTAKFENGTYDWTYYAGKDAYDRYFAPFISNWGVTQPTGAAANGYCYYYKDYATQGIRLIAIDVMGWDSTQLSWFQATLASAKSSSLSVIVAGHYQFDGSGVTGLATGFNSYVGWSTGTDTYTPGDAISAVDTFISGGGKFICWLLGHTHRDYVGYLAEHNNQLGIVVGTDASDSDNLAHADAARVQGTDSQDLFNAVAFDTTQHQIRIVRVGSDSNKQLQSRKTLCIEYDENGTSVPQIVNQS